MNEHKIIITLKDGTVHEYPCQYYFLEWSQDELVMTIEGVVANSVTAETKLVIPNTQIVQIQVEDTNEAKKARKLTW